MLEERNKFAGQRGTETSSQLAPAARGACFAPGHDYALPQSKAQSTAQSNTEQVVELWKALRKCQEEARETDA